MTINSKFKGLSAAAAAFSLFAITPARSGPVLPDRLELSARRAPIEPARYHWQRHYHQAYAADDYAAEELAMTALFWPLWSSECFFGGCGWTVATDPGCYFYGCGAGWGLGPFAWGLFGLGFADPYGIYGWGYSGPGYGGSAIPVSADMAAWPAPASAPAWAPVWAPACLPGVISRAAISGWRPRLRAAPFRRLARSPRTPFRRLSQLWRPSFRRLSRFRRPPFHGVPRRRLRRRLPWRAGFPAASMEAASMEGDSTAAAAVSPRVLSPGRSPARRWRRGFESNARPERQYDLALPDGRLV